MGNPTGENGLRTFSAHVHDALDSNRIGLLKASRMATASFSLPAGLPLQSLSAESAAVRHVTQAIQSVYVPEMQEKTQSGIEQEFKTLGTETVPLTGTTIVKFRQTINKIPVYGSLISAELDEENELISLNSSMGDPTAVSPIASVSPADAIRAASKKADAIAPADSVPRLYYYYSDTGTWHLAYIIEDVTIPSKRVTLFDVVVDAHSGEVLAQLPRTANLQVTAKDGLGKERQIIVSELGDTVLAMRDLSLNVHTYDFGFDDPDTGNSRLPGKYVMYNQGWNPMAVSAHANTTAVIEFLRKVVMRQSIDNKGGPLISSINCLVRKQAQPGNVWLNAYWNSSQMVYGQASVQGKLVSLATSLDIVGHEIFHGVTEKTARLEYANQPGALNESLSDIFGVIISNFDRELAQWNWEIGDGFGGMSLRDMVNPNRFNQPKHMDRFEVLPNTEDGDWGGVHTNSGIINHAAYLIMSSKTPEGNYLFVPSELAALFYFALSQLLSRSSNFAQFRSAVESAGKSVFRKNAEAVIQAKLASITDGFDKVGIFKLS
jgi:Zn-dependent metalloprotease